MSKIGYQTSWFVSCVSGFFAIIICWLFVKNKYSFEILLQSTKYSYKAQKKLAMRDCIQPRNQTDRRQKFGKQQEQGMSSRPEGNGEL